MIVTAQAVIFCFELTVKKIDNQRPINTQLGDLTV